MDHVPGVSIIELFFSCMYSNFGECRNLTRLVKTKQNKDGQRHEAVLEAKYHFHQGEINGCDVFSERTLLLPSYTEGALISSSHLQPFAHTGSSTLSSRIVIFKLHCSRL